MAAFRGARVEEVGPSEPARISGFNTVPPSGALFSIVKNKKEAEQQAAEKALEALEKLTTPAGD